MVDSSRPASRPPAAGAFQASPQAIARSLRTARDTRVVVTGLGVVSPIGIGPDAFWDSLKNGRSGIDRLSTAAAGSLPSKLAAEVRDFDPLHYVYQKKFLKVMSRDIQLGVSAASMAMADAGLRPGDIDPTRLGVEFGAGHISFTPDELSEAARDYADPSDRDGYTRWGEGEPPADAPAPPMDKIAPLWMLRQLPNMPACHVAIEHDAQGPNNTITGGDVSALLALAEAMRVIERDQADAMIVGACSSQLNPVELARMNVCEQLSPADDPDEAPRPFDLRRDGGIAGEGAAVFVLERYESAVARGADIYGEVLSVAAGCDGSSLDGRGLAGSIRRAIETAGVTPDQFGHINAHATGAVEDDVIETAAYHRGLGDAASRIPVTALKSYFGNFDAGGGAVELAGSLLSLRHGLVPQSLHYRTPDPRCRLNVVSDGPRELTSSLAMSVNRTRLGQSTAAIFRSL